MQVLLHALQSGGRGRSSVPCNAPSTLSEKVLLLFGSTDPHTIPSLDVVNALAKGVTF